MGTSGQSQLILAEMGNLPEFTTHIKYLLKCYGLSRTVCFSAALK